MPGSRLVKGSAVYCAVDEITGVEKISRHKSDDDAYVAQVCILGKRADTCVRLCVWLYMLILSHRSIQKVSLKTLYNRTPVTGDKFSSRHGQKGVLSFAWPDENMPFVSRTGMRPDIIINPHAFPSRMTIGMLVESLASKHGCLAGCFADGSPFQSAGGAGPPAVTFGEMISERGFNPAGSETMINGMSGEHFKVSTFFTFRFQRLRHQTG